jgi:RNA-binding protein
LFSAFGSAPESTGEMPANQGFSGAMIPCAPFPPRSFRMPLVLTPAQNRFLRGQAHGLKAMLQLGGKGLTDAVVAEIDNALEHHELIKVKITAEDRETRDGVIAALIERSGAALVQRIGHVAVLYRPNRDRRQIVLPRGGNRE